VSDFLQLGKYMFISIAVRFNNTAGLIGTQLSRSLLYAYLHAEEPCRFDTVEIYLPLRVYIAEVPKMWGASPPGGGPFGALGG
jgi:hypothetical protein